VRSRRLAIVLVALFAAACTRSEAGQPSAAGGGPTSEAGRPPTSGSAVAIPARPRELKLDGIDPCTLFTDAQLAQLSLERKRPRITDKGMKDCAMDALKAPFDHYSAVATTNEGIGAWLTGKRNVDAKLSSVAGFAAATYWFRGAHDHNTPDCTISVDVAEGQSLTVSADNDGKQTYTLEQLCQRAEQAAGLAIQTLQTLK
jgi:Protein of unknown function (DUF3558)